VNQKDSDRGSEFATTVRFVFTATSLSMLQHRPDYFSRSACGARPIRVEREDAIRWRSRVVRRFDNANALSATSRAPQVGRL